MTNALNSESTLRHAPDLIIDVGAHQGLDTEFYLRKGFRVVAVEANPLHQAAIRQRLAPYLASGQLQLLEVGILDAESEFDFYRNLENDEWSSFDRAIGTRRGTAFEVIRIPCIRFDRVLQEHGIPHYLKVDIEGADQLVLESLLRCRALPAFLSVEASSLECLAYMRILGYESFQMLDQTGIWKIKLPDPPLEGNYVRWQFGACMSGPFGAEIPGGWRTFSDVALEFLEFQTNPPPGSTAWFDFHAARPDHAARLPRAPARPRIREVTAPAAVDVSAGSPLDEQVATLLKAAQAVRASGARSVVVAGAGAIARTAVLLLQQTGVRVLAMDDADPAGWGTKFGGIPIMAPSDAIDLNPDAYFIGSFGSIPAIRERIATLARDRQRSPCPVFSAPSA